MSKQISVLIIDDEKNSRWSLTKGLTNYGYTCYSAANKNEAAEFLENNSIQIILLDINLGEENGIDLIKDFLNMKEDLKIIMITAYNDIKKAVASIKNGAFDYITKPFELEEIDISINKALKYISLENEINELKSITGENLPEIIGNSEPIKKLKKILSKTFNNDAPVLITGESGTGKELCAKAIHSYSERKDKPFIAANIAALPDNLVEAELFGYEKGAFTGAVKARRGYFEIADGGILFLDEIGEISPIVQVKLLRVLETGEIPVIGSEKIKKVDVRIIGATNRNIKEEVKERNFREDLFYRISVFQINVPPLRQRNTDLELLINYFTEKYAKEKNVKKTISNDAIKKLYKHSWPGNVRELFHVIERAILISEKDEISEIDIPDFDFENLNDKKDLNLTDMVENYEKSIIGKALKENNENQVQTAKYLGLSRTSLIYKLKKYNFLTDND